MLLPLSGRNIYYDLAGPEQGTVVYLCHALAADSGMWAEQVPPLLAKAIACCASTCAATAAAMRRPGITCRRISRPT